MGGALRLFRFRGVPVEVHWSALLLLLVVRGGGNGLLRLLAMVIIVIVHELGHAALVRHFALKLHAIRVYGFGGECLHAPARSKRDDVVIAWGGVLAQLALCACALGLLALQLPLPTALRVVLETFTWTNLALAAFNLLPLPPLDGHRAWRLKYLLPPARKRRRLARTGDKSIDSLVDDALERARADSAAQRRKQGPTKSGDDRD